MSIEKLVRLSGIAALLCGLATVLFWFLHPSAADPQAPHDAAFFAAVQEPRFQAVFLLFTTLILLSLGLLGALFAGTGLSFAAGYLLLGIAMLRTQVFPKGAAILLMLGAPVLGLSPLMPLWARIVGCIFWGSGNIWLGYMQLTADVASSHLGKGAPHGLEQAV